MAAFYYIYRPDTNEGSAMRDCTLEEATAAAARHYGESNYRVVEHDDDAAFDDPEWLRGLKATESEPAPKRVFPWRNKA